MPPEQAAPRMAMERSGAHENLAIRILQEHILSSVALAHSAVQRNWIFNPLIP